MFGAIPHMLAQTQCRQAAVVTVVVFDCEAVLSGELFKSKLGMDGLGGSKIRRH